MHPNLLDQIAVFRTVADSGSFAAAARRLNRRVSAVSYAITNLEEHLGLTLIDRSSYRAGLTPEGRALLADVDVLLRRVERLEGRAEALRHATETSLVIAAEHSVPAERIAAALSRFEPSFPAVEITLRTAVTADVVEAVREGHADIGLIALERGLQWTDIDGAQLLAETILLVAASGHPLATQDGDLKMEALEHHRQIYLASADPPPSDTPHTDYRMHRTDIWRAGDLASQLALIEAGLGWGYVPETAARDAIHEGRLVALASKALRDLPVRRFGVIWCTRSPPGPAGEALMAAFAAEGSPAESR